MEVRDTDAAGHGTAAGAAAAVETTAIVAPTARQAGRDERLRALGLGAAAVIVQGKRPQTATATGTTGHRRARQRGAGRGPEEDIRRSNPTGVFRDGQVHQATRFFRVRRRRHGDCRQYVLGGTRLTCVPLPMYIR